MWMLQLFVFALGVVLIWAGMPTLGAALVFAIALDGFCKEFGRGGGGRD